MIITNTRSGRSLLAVLALAATGVAVACQPPPEPTTCNGFPATILGTSGDDVIDGTSGMDVIVGLAGNDFIRGLGGDDRLCGGSGADQAFGGEGYDWLDGSPGADHLNGGPQADIVSYRYHPKRVFVSLQTSTGGDNDVVVDVEDVQGSPFDDYLEGDDRANKVDGFGGNDVLVGWAGDDLLYDFAAAPSNDHLAGGRGNDQLIGGPGRDTVGFDAVTAGPVEVDLELGTSKGEGNDTVQEVEDAIGTSGNDVLLGNGYVNTLQGGEGKDTLVGRLGDDVVIGGPGLDAAGFTGPFGVTANLVNDEARGEGADRLLEIESLTGGTGDDHFTGDPGPNVLDGRAGFDTCYGQGGADTLLSCP